MSFLEQVKNALPLKMLQNKQELLALPPCGTRTRTGRLCGFTNNFTVGRI